MVQNQVDHIKELCEDLDWCDGISAVDHFSTDGTYEVLEKNKKKGKIIQIPWIDLHYVSKTYCLQNGVIRPGDWVYALDSQERVCQDFVCDIKEKIKGWESQGIGCIFWGKPLIFKKSYGMAYFGNPHCFPSPISGKVLNVEDSSTVVKIKDDEIYSGRYLLNKKNPDNTIIFHGSKYYFCEMSNQLDMFYERYGKECLTYHHQMRYAFLTHLEKILGEKPTIYNFLDLVRTWINGSASPDPQILDYIDFEFPIKDAIRLKILGQHRNDIVKNRHNWSFKHFLLTRDSIQDNTSYEGTIPSYERQMQAIK